jgi:hypothetical protein
MSKAGRLRGYIAPTFGTIAGGRNNLRRVSIAATMNEEAAPVFVASFVWKPIGHYPRLCFERRSE